jgi:hypothetical protein
LLKEDEEVLKPAAGVKTDNNDKLIQEFNQDKDLKLAKALKNTYLTPPLTDEEDEDSPYTFYIKYPLNRAAEDSRERDLKVELNSTLAVKLDLMLAGRAV